MKRIVATFFLTLAVVVVALGGFVYSGIYDIGADSSHATPVATLLATTRERAVSRHAGNIQVQLPQGQEALLVGAEHYAAMCAPCHLAPGMPNSELRKGLNPSPPDFSRHRIEDPARAFWVAKHGIKFTGMPAWGPTHDDETLWKVVAFVRQLPDLSAEEYGKMSGEGDGHASGHGHQGHADGEDAAEEHHSSDHPH